MGVAESKVSNPSPQKIVPKFGGIKNIDKPRPGYYASGQGVYYNGKLLTSEPSWFQKLNYGYAKNNKVVWYKGEPIKDADPESFETVTRNNITLPVLKKYNSALGKDKRGWYLKGNIILLN